MTLRFGIKCALLDITGVLCESGLGSEGLIPGSIEAISKLKNAGIPIGLVTNETCVTPVALFNQLIDHGYDNITLNEIFSPVPAVKSALKERNLRPHLLVHQKIKEEFDEFSKENPNCIVVGDADEDFTFENINNAFRALMDMDKPLIISLGKGKFYKHKGRLQLDVGSFVAALEYACDTKAEVIGKPSPLYFQSALKILNYSPSEAVMVGDDIVSDVGAAQGCGIKGILVRTGKFIPSHENHPTVKPDFIADNLLHAVKYLLNEI